MDFLHQYYFTASIFIVLISLILFGVGVYIRLFVFWPRINQLTANVFISYRRDAQQIVLRFKSELKHKLIGGEIFVDLDGIAPGEDFSTKIGSAITRSNIVLVIISRDFWNEKLLDPEDWIVKEVKLASEAEKKIVPVVIDGAEIIKSKDYKNKYTKELPAQFSFVKKSNAVFLGTEEEHFKRGVQKTVDIVRRYGGRRIVENIKWVDVISFSAAIIPSAIGLLLLLLVTSVLRENRANDIEVKGLYIKVEKELSHLQSVTALPGDLSWLAKTYKEFDGWDFLKNASESTPYSIVTDAVFSKKRQIEGGTVYMFVCKEPGSCNDRVKLAAYEASNEKFKEELAGLDKGAKVSMSAWIVNADELGEIRIDLRAMIPLEI